MRPARPPLSGNQTEDAAIWLLYKRLYTFSLKCWRATPTEATDAVGAAICEALSSGNKNFSYLAQVTHNHIRIQRRNRSRRGEYNPTPVLVDDDGRSDAVDHLLQMEASQDDRVLVKQIASSIEQMPTQTRAVMVLAGLEHTADEIAQTLGIAKKEVYWRLQVGRKILREGDGFQATKRGHPRFVGIRRDHHRWSAAIRKGETYESLGRFASAAEAAQAYDIAAKRLFGPAAKLNFPDAR